MNSKILMTVSALFLATLGTLTLFFPHEVLAQHGTEPDGPTVLLIEMMGAIYLGFALLNWGARGVIMGGAYSRPLAAGNFMHFAVVTISLAREAIDHQVIQLAGSAFVFGLFALGFGWVLFRSSPANSEQH